MSSAPPRPRRSRPSTDGVVLVPMQRRHVKAVLRIEHQVYPKPWTESLFLSELALPASARRSTTRQAAVVRNP